MTVLAPASIPLVDLAAQHRAVADEVRDGFERVMARSGFIGGEEVAAFEDEYATFSGVRHCVGVANGTDALVLLLRALEIGPGDEVIVPANSFIASAEAVATVGASVRFADCDPHTLLIDPASAHAAITSRTAAVMPVHLYGQVAPMEAIQLLARHRGLAVVEDAAQAHGAHRAGCPAGGFAAGGGTSFYPGKNLGAYGDAGAVLTNHADIADRVRLLANHGSRAKYVHEVSGVNSRLDALQAVVLRAKLRHLAAWNDARTQAAAQYAALLGDVDGLGQPHVDPAGASAWHLYVVRVRSGRRDEVLAALHAAGIDAGIHYPTPLHLQPAFAAPTHGLGAFPTAEAAAGELLSLPLHPHLTLAQQERVASVVIDALR